MKKVMLSRDEAEYLVDVLEGTLPPSVDDYIAIMVAAFLRESFGMVTKEQQEEYQRGLNEDNNSRG